VNEAKKEGGRGREGGDGREKYDPTREVVEIFGPVFGHQ
jgi:hypothetical protein